LMSLVRSVFRCASRTGRSSATPRAEWRDNGRSEWRYKDVEMADIHYSTVS